MARRKAGADEPGEQEQQEQKERQASAVISGPKLKRLMAAKRSTTKDMHELMGQLGQSIKDACDNDHLHRKAFGVICAADKMEPEKLADFFDHLDYYRDVSGLNKRAASVMRMPGIDKKDEDGDDEGAEEATGDNVAKFPATAGTA